MKDYAFKKRFLAYFDCINLLNKMRYKKNAANKTILYYNFT